jgi:glycosyltransferase involved in cell wall biosynthesis
VSHRIGCVGYATEQGLGHLMRDFYRNGVVTDVIIFRHPHGDRSRPTHAEWYPPGTPVVTRPFVGEAFERFLDDLHAVLFFETPFDWDYVRRCREREVRTVLVPMYEWHLQNPPQQFDAYVNPSLLDQRYFPHGTFLPVPVDPARWARRTRALRFLHNAGHVGSRNHKGTEEVLRAFPLLTKPLRLTVRCQDTPLLIKLHQQVFGNEPFHGSTNRHGAAIHFETGSQSYGTLFDGHDVFVMAEKFNGLSLPLQEARAAGMAVVTSNRFPMNTWLNPDHLIPVREYRRAQCMRGHLEFDEAVVLPEDVAAALDRLYDQDLTQDSNDALAWANDNSWASLKDRWVRAVLGV